MCELIKVLILIGLFHIPNHIFAFQNSFQMELIITLCHFLNLAFQKYVLLG